MKCDIVYFPSYFPQHFQKKGTERRKGGFIEREKVSWQPERGQHRK